MLIICECYKRTILVARDRETSYASRSKNKRLLLVQVNQGQACNWGSETNESKGLYSLRIPLLCIPCFADMSLCLPVHGVENMATHCSQVCTLGTRHLKHRLLLHRSPSHSSSEETHWSICLMPIPSLTDSLAVEQTPIASINMGSERRDP